MKIVQVPGVNGLGKTEGAAGAPEKIESKSDIINLKGLNLPEQQEKIFQESKTFIESGKTIFLGGDHSISYPLTKAFFEVYKDKNPCLIVFDAHADCMPPMKEPTHEEWLRASTIAGFPSRNIIIIGSRVNDPEENAFLEQSRIRTFSVQDVMDDPREVLSKINEITQNNPTYISFDIDVFDATLVPATGYPEEFGFRKSDCLKFLINLKNKVNLKAADIVEVHTNHRQSDVDRTVHLAREVLDILKN